MYPPGKRQPNDFDGYRRLRRRQKMCREIMIGAVTHILAGAVTAAFVWVGMTAVGAAEQEYWKLWVAGDIEKAAIHEGPQAPTPEFHILPPG